MMARTLVLHARRHVIAYIALTCALLALGGAAYAQFRIPWGSVGERQLKNYAIDPVKWDPNYVTGFIAGGRRSARPDRCCRRAPAARAPATAPGATSSPGATRSPAGAPRRDRDRRVRGGPSSGKTGTTGTTGPTGATGAPSMGTYADARS